MFTNAYTCNPKCAPSRANILAGRFSWQLEETCNHNPIVNKKWQFYPYILESKGYEIGGTGKGWGPGTWNGKVCYSNFDNPAGYLHNQIKLMPPFDKMSDIDYSANFDDFIKKEMKVNLFVFGWERMNHIVTMKKEPGKKPERNCQRL